MEDKSTQSIEVPFIKKELGIDINVKGYRVLIRAPMRSEKTSGGIYMPNNHYKDTQERNMNIGLVLKVGPTAFSEGFSDRLSVPGEWVYYSTYEREKIEPRPGIICYFINDERIFAGVPPEDVPIILKDFS